MKKIIEIKKSDIQRIIDRFCYETYYVDDYNYFFGINVRNFLSEVLYVDFISYGYDLNEWFQKLDEISESIDGRQDVNLRLKMDNIYEKYQNWAFSEDRDDAVIDCIDEDYWECIGEIIDRILEDLQKQTIIPVKITA